MEENQKNYSDFDIFKLLDSQLEHNSFTYLKKQELPRCQNSNLYKGFNLKK